MNTEKVQHEIEQICMDVYGRGWKLKQREIAKDRKLAEELGIWEVIPMKYRKYAEVVKAVLQAAQDAGGKVVRDNAITRDFEGDYSETITEASALYKALHEDEQPADNPETGSKYNAGFVYTSRLNQNPSNRMETRDFGSGHRMALNRFGQLITLTTSDSRLKK